jgi:endonuclease G
LYIDNDLDRGHMVRRLDPVWGDAAETANEDTFHYTNSCPQHKDLNQKTWNDLEDYVLLNAGKHQLKLNVFTGPVFRRRSGYRDFRSLPDY